MKLIFVVFIGILGMGCEPTGRVLKEDFIPDAGPPLQFSGPEQDAGTPLVSEDAGNSTDCDVDGDGFEAILCGGTDCDDDDPFIHPQAIERCSFVDENCNESHNEFLDCSFMAAGPNNLYRVDPFFPKVEWLSTVDHAGDSGGMLDIDINPEGKLIVVKKQGLYTLSDEGDLVAEGNFEDANGAAVTLSQWTNGMAINSFGTIFLTNSDEDHSVDPYESAALAHTVDPDSRRVMLLGSLAPYVSSGDCVALKNDSILMTARYPSDQATTDLLVFVDSESGQTTLIGDTGYTGIFGLSASFGYLFGVTKDAKVLKINEETAETILLLDCGEGAGNTCPSPPSGENSIRFYGAANGD